MDRKKFLINVTAAVAGLSFPGVIRVFARQQPQPAGDVVVFNAGVSGNNSNNLLSRLQTDCINNKPALTIIMIGTNDMCNGKHVTPEKFGQNLGKLITAITAAGSKILLLSILPFYEPYFLTRHPAGFFAPEGPDGKRAGMNAVIKTVAGQYQTSFFDVAALFEKVGKVGTDKDSLIRNEVNSGKTDGVHPTPNGYRFLALAISQFIQYHQLPTSRIVCFGDSITHGDGSVDRESYPAYLKKLLS